MVIQLNLKQLAFECICAISETSSSKHSLLITGVMLLSLTELVGDVRVSGGKTDSTVDISRARPSAGTVSCQVAELKASETSSAILVSLCRLEINENKGSIRHWIKSLGQIYIGPYLSEGLRAGFTSEREPPEGAGRISVRSRAREIERNYSKV